MNARTRLAVVLSGAALAACGGSSDAPAPSPSATTSSAKPPDPPKPAADPMTDVAAWKALAAAERAAKAAGVVSKVDAGDSSAVEKCRAFLAERGEDDAVGALAKAALAKGGCAEWEHRAVGDVNVAAEVDACLKSCEAAEDAAEEKFTALKAQRAAHPGSWWTDSDATKKVRALCAEAKAADALLATPYGQGVQHWVKWQRAIDVMKDSPAVHGARGPYLVFVSLDSMDAAAKAAAKAAEKADPDGRRTKRRPPREMKDVPPAEVERATKILNKNLDLMEKFYDGWMAELGPVFGLTRYDASNSDESTLFKMNVFCDAEEYELYSAKSGSGMGGFARAYYSPQEPRFITTYDGGAEHESSFETDQTQCHEATHQLVHFYTWDLSRKALNRDVKWLDCYVRPTWSNEGFAEFFSSFAMKDGKYVWMQPLDSRMSELWILGEIVADKKWRPWELKEFLSIRTAGQLEELSGQRSMTQGALEHAVAGNVMANLFYAKAWSFVYFMWYAEEGGKPKYRDRFVEYLKREFHLVYKFDTIKQAELTLNVGVPDFRKIMGIEKDDKLAAFEKEWLAYETKFVASHKSPKWDAERAMIRKNLKIDK